jgi:sugar phosphate isomerase/epimerase
MAVMSRREFLEKATRDTAVAGMLAAGVRSAAAGPLGLPIGSQVYPHRALLKDFAGFVKTMAEIGVESLELCSPIGYGADFASLANAKEVKRILADQGMTCMSGHFSMKELRETQSESIAWAREVGITQMIAATLGGGNSPTMDDVKRAADEYNGIAARAAEAGIQQGLHNEGFEHSTVDGRRTYDVLLERLDPKLVKFQFQMSAAGRGFIAADYFTKYPGRFISMHLQDVKLDVAPAAGGRVPGAALGKGSIDWVKTFTAARAGGVKNYFVEQNLELTRESVAFLKALKV